MPRIFDNDRDDQVMLDLYNEKSDILDGDAEIEAGSLMKLWRNWLLL